MADEQPTTVVTPGQPAPETPAPPAGAQNTEQPAAEHMVPKSRFDEVNTELKKLKALVTEADNARTKAEQEKLKEAGEYKKLYEDLGAKLTAAEQETKALRLAALRREAAEQVAGFPAGLAERLKGETLEEMTADAKQVLAALPKTQVNGVPSTPKPSGNTDAAQTEQARQAAAAGFYRTL